MSNFISTLYTHYPNFDLIINTIIAKFPDIKIDYDRGDNAHVADLTIKGGFLMSDKKMQITYRERVKSSYKLEESTDPLVLNLQDLHKMVSDLPSNNENIKKLLLKKIESCNAELSIKVVEKAQTEFKELNFLLAKTMNAFVFTQGETNIGKSTTQHFLNEQLELILDLNGNNSVNHLDVKIDSRYIDAQNTGSKIQLSRKERSEAILRSKNIKINQNLSPIEEESIVKIRDVKKVSERLVALALTNLVAFKNITGKQALEFAEQNQVMPLLTAKELHFLENPTDEACSQETWKCECIWVLSWALNHVNELGFPDVLANLADIPADKYPIGSGTNPPDFISTNHLLRSKKAILDMADLYYRFHWACVDARIHEKEISTIHSGVVYERHHALNWLINYQDQEWDEVSTDI